MSFRGSMHTSLYVFSEGTSSVSRQAQTVSQSELEKMLEDGFESLRLKVTPTGGTLNDEIERAKAILAVSP